MSAPVFPSESAIDGASRRVEVVVCVNLRTHPGRPSCAARGGEAIAEALEARGAQAGFSVMRIRCFGQCERGPNVRIAPGGEFFHAVEVDDLERILAAATDRRT